MNRTAKAGNTNVLLREYTTAHHVNGRAPQSMAKKFGFSANNFDHPVTLI
eukprot:TRINITY_DN714_c0_g1_i1.p1 TRINITY_DN714_c0_g1~~TRINITY_DN714_c0_g1_i1.p1  ORF type:complete len:50 (-),score=0.32 TRINITY_DN714_c0_g1_i1:213-362(-)